MFGWVTSTIESAANYTQQALDAVVGEDEESRKQQRRSDSTEDMSVAAKFMFGVEDEGAKRQARPVPAASSGGLGEVVEDAEDPHVNATRSAPKEKVQTRAPQPAVVEQTRAELTPQPIAVKKPTVTAVKPMAAKKAVPKSGVETQPVVTRTNKALPPPKPSGQPAKTSSTGKGAEQEEEGWMPKELKFASTRGQGLLSAGKTLLESGAGMMNTYLGDEEESEGNEKQSPTATAGATAPKEAHEKATVAAANPTATAEDVVVEEELPAKDPLETLRTSRGDVEFRRRKRGMPVVDDEAIMGVLDPTIIAEYDAADGDASEVEWMAATELGEKMAAARAKAIDKIAQNGTAPTEYAAYEAMPEFPAVAERCAASVADILLDAFVHLATQEVPQWVTHAQPAVDETLQNSAVPSCENDEWMIDSSLREINVRAALNVMDAAKFALHEIESGTQALCTVAQDAQVWAKRSGHAEAKAIKERALAVRGECFVSGAAAVARIEEAIECVVTLLPPPVVRRRRMSKQFSEDSPGRAAAKAAALAAAAAAEAPKPVEEAQPAVAVEEEDPKPAEADTVEEENSAAAGNNDDGWGDDSWGSDNEAPPAAKEESPVKAPEAGSEIESQQQPPPQHVDPAAELAQEQPKSAESGGSPTKTSTKTKNKGLGGAVKKKD